MPLLIVTLLLLLYGLLALFSVSVHESFATTLSLIAKGLYTGEASNYFYFFKQLNNLFYIAALAYITYLVPLKIFKNEKFLIALSIVLVIFQLLVFTPWGVPYWGARWWLDLPGLPSIQPVEFFKLGYVIFMSWWFIRKQHLLNSSAILKRFFVLNAIIFFIFLLIPDLWSVLIMAITWVIIGIYAGISVKNIARMAIVGLGWLGIIIRGFLWINRSYCVGVPLTERPSICRYGYIATRVEVYLNPSSDETGQNASWQGRQALIAIGWWWFLGNGYGKWLQKFGYIPEAQSDFIFSAYAEEVWFIGIFVLFLLYALLVYFVIIRVAWVKDPFFRHLSIGLLSLIIVGAFIHIGVNIQLLPNTWLTLPFISYGGTALMTDVISIVLLYKILYLHPHKIY